MKQAQDWRPSKFELSDAGLRASRDTSEVGTGSRLIGDLVSRFYGRAIPRFATGDLLDLGCGKAPLYELYSRYTNSVICVDWANSLHANPHLDLIQDLNDPLPLESNRFQTVILSDVLEHIRNPSGLMAEIARVLQPGGRLLMNVPFFYPLHEEPHDYYRFTRYALEHLATSVGMEVVELESIGGYPEVLSDLVSKLVGHVPVVGSRMALAIQYLVAKFVSRGFGRTFSLKTRETWPLGYTMVAGLSPQLIEPPLRQAESASLPEPE